ncbi:hypothetical protein EDC02_1576 [Micromonospora sp. Llam0]|nr:hypothetical protein EDC02_1576 [Micromonospora sp. Llam0]
MKRETRSWGNDVSESAPTRTLSAHALILLPSCQRRRAPRASHPPQGEESPSTRWRPALPVGEVGAELAGGLTLCRQRQHQVLHTRQSVLALAYGRRLERTRPVPGARRFLPARRRSARSSSRWSVFSPCGADSSTIFVSRSGPTSPAARLADAYTAWDTALDAIGAVRQTQIKIAGLQQPRRRLWQSWTASGTAWHSTATTHDQPGRQHQTELDNRVRALGGLLTGPISVPGTTAGSVWLPWPGVVGRCGRIPRPVDGRSLPRGDCFSDLLGRPDPGPDPGKVGGAALLESIGGSGPVVLAELGGDPNSPVPMWPSPPPNGCCRGWAVVGPVRDGRRRTKMATIFYWLPVGRFVVTGCRVNRSADGGSTTGTGPLRDAAGLLCPGELRSVGWMSSWWTPVGVLVPGTVPGWLRTCSTRMRRPVSWCGGAGWLIC